MYLSGLPENKSVWQSACTFTIHQGLFNYVSFRTVYIAYLTDAVFFGKSFFDQGDPNMSGN